MTLKLLGAILFAGVRPRSTHERLVDTPHWFAIAVHCAGYLLVTIVLMLPEWPYSGLVGELRSELSRELADPGQWLIVPVILLLAEAAHWLFALALVAWGSWKAPVREVWRRSLRVVWLFTPQIAWAMLMMGMVDIVLAGLKPMGEYRTSHEMISAGVFAALVLASVASMLRAVTAPLPEQTDLDLNCEWCGYNLTHQPADSDCPECGKPVAASLHTSRQPGPTSVHGNRRFSFMGCHWRAWLHPETFFRGLTTRDGRAAAGAFLLINLAVSVIGFVLGFVVTLNLFEPGALGSDWLEAIVFVGGVGGVAALIHGSLASLTAAVPGMLISRRHGRNRVGACMLPACYCSGLFAIWSTVFPVLFVTMMMLMMGEMRAVERWFRALVFMSFFGVQVVFLLLYIVMVLRRFGYTVHANR